MANHPTDKQYPVPTNPQVVRSATAARILADPNEARVLAMFAKEERSLVEAAHALGTASEGLFECVQRLVRYKLLFVTRIERRGKHAERYYQAAAQYVIPADIMPPAEWWSRANERWDRRFLHAVEQDELLLAPQVKVTFAAGGEVHVTATSATAEAGRPVIPRALSECGCVSLHADQLPAFRRAFSALLAQFASPEGQGAEVYLYRVTLAPLADER